MTSLKIGDKVKVTNDLQLAQTDNAFDIKSMSKLLGLTGTVKAFQDSWADVDLGDYGYWFFKTHLLTKVEEPKMLELKQETSKKTFGWMKVNSGTIVVNLDNKSYTIGKDHLNYAKIDEAIKKNDATALSKLVDVCKTLQKYASPVNGVEVKDGLVWRNGTPLHNSLATRILSLYREGYPIDPMVKFLDNLMNNPSKRAIEELYPFLEHRGLPITDDGCFLGYKRIREDWKDWHSGKIDNSIGKTVSVERNTVDDNWREACSSGLHVGCLEYVKQFHPGSRVVIVKVNPKDVVSVPYNEVTKLRTASYTVLQEYDREMLTHLEGSLYTANGQLADSVDWDEDYDDEDCGW